MQAMDDPSPDKADMLWLWRYLRNAQFALQLTNFPGVYLEASLPASLPQDAPMTSTLDAKCCCNQTLLLMHARIVAVLVQYHSGRVRIVMNFASVPCKSGFSLFIRCPTSGGNPSCQFETLSTVCVS